MIDATDRRRRWPGRLGRILLAPLGLMALALVAWAVAIGPVAMWRVITYGTTTVWDHEEYPGRALDASPSPAEWAADITDLPATVVLDGVETPLEQTLIATRSLSFLVVSDGVIVHEWYAEDHDPDRAVMLFSVTKSILSLLIGAAIDDGILGPVDTPVTEYLPELADAGFGDVTLEQLLRMDSGVDYVEGDNPFGEHVEFNYTDDLTGAILGLGVRDDRPEPFFRYKSGDFALLGLALDRALGEESITGYLEDRLWDALGASDEGMWSTDREDGLERAWCCLAMTARDLARFGQMVLDGGERQGQPLVSSGWLDASFLPGFPSTRWPGDYQGSPLVNYGYGWWLTRAGASLALGKDGQYLYIDRASRVVLVRQGEASGDVSWVGLFDEVAQGLG